MSNLAAAYLTGLINGAVLVACIAAWRGRER